MRYVIRKNLASGRRKTEITFPMINFQDNLLTYRGRCIVKDTENVSRIRVLEHRLYEAFNANRTVESLFETREKKVAPGGRLALRKLTDERVNGRGPFLFEMHRRRAKESVFLLALPRAFHVDQTATILEAISFTRSTRHYQTGCCRSCDTTPRLSHALLALLSISHSIEPRCFGNRSS